MDREKRSLLVVDGSSTFLFYVGMLLKKLEYEVYTSQTAEEALRTMKEAVPVLVITDIPLPRMSGINLLRQMKQDPLLKAVPVIIHTSENDPGIKDTCLRAGCASYLTKPAEPDDLYRAIQLATESTPRHHIRLGTSLKAVIGDGTVLGGAVRTEYVTAVSEGGMYIRTLYPQPVNAALPVSMYIKDREIRVEAVVLYSSSMGEGPFKEPGMGMKFVKISPEDKAFVREFIKEQLMKDIAL